jgi:alkylation response protein AidB-like acyl-CoA dehydrogenase
MTPDKLTSEQRMMLAAVDRFTVERLEPRAADIDESGLFSAELYAEVAELGLLATMIPEPYGGIDVGVRTVMLAVERMARVSPGFAISVANLGDGVSSVIHGASEDIKKSVLPEAASGQAIVAFALTEPGSGSDNASLRMKAIRDGDDYLLTGQKIYITNGSVSDYFTVYARTSEDPRNGVSAFLVPRSAPGVSLGRDENLIGLRGTPASVVNFDSVRVPSDWRLGDEGDGFRLAMVSLDEARLNISAIALGICRRALDESIEFARNRVSFGQPIIRHQGIGFLLADLASEMAAAWSIFDRALDAYENNEGRAASTLVSMAKLATTAAAMRITTEAIQIHGGAGLTRDYIVEKLFRDAKACQILDGTTQIQELIISRQLEKVGFPYEVLGW